MFSRADQSSSEWISRSRTLRRADWRFLLAPAAARLIVAKAPHDLVSAARILGERVAHLDDAVTEADLAVLSDPSRDDLRRAHTVLAPGGACYVEWTRPFASGRARRRLRDAGFAGVQRYWFWPPPTRAVPSMWLPLEGAAAGAHLGTAARARGTRASRTSARVLRGAWLAARRGFVVAPIATVAWKASAGERRPHALTDEIRRRWEAWGLGETPRSISCVVRSPGASILNKILIFVFADREAAPRLTLKLARTPESEPGLRREASSLEAVAGTSAARAADVPALVFCQRLAGTLAVGETPLDGRPVIHLLNDRSLNKIALQVAEVLRAFLEGAPAADPADWLSRIVALNIAGFRARFADVVDPAHVASLEFDLERLPPLPAIPEHRDCSPWNTFLSGTGRLVLLDWESAEPRGLPGMDLVYFLANASFLSEGTLGTGRERTTYVRMLDPRTRVGRVFASAVARYLDGTGIAPSTLAPLRRLAWMIHACGEFDRIAAARPHLDARETSRASVYYGLWEEDARRRTPGSDARA